jgi:hypothetical protein
MVRPQDQIKSRMERAANGMAQHHSFVVMHGNVGDKLLLLLQ